MSSSSSVAITERPPANAQPRKRQKTLDGSSVEPVRSLISIQALNKATVMHLMSGATRMKAIVETQGGDERLRGKVLATLFYEPSTRTSCSFATAMLRLGGSVLPVAESTSSAVKGETLADTVQCLGCYADAIVLRHPQKGSAAEAAAASPVPLINAGDGVGEHPTQALLDLFTILDELGGVQGKTVTMLGDLKHGRTVHSLARMLALFAGVRVQYVSPASLRMPEEIVDELAQQGLSQTQHEDIDAVIRTTDVLYVTRVQKERFASEEQYMQVRDAFVVDPPLLAKAKDRMVVMHPLPRVKEISTAVDSDPRAAYFRQMRNGLYVRMALLSYVLLGHV